MFEMMVFFSPCSFCWDCEEGDENKGFCVADAEGLIEPPDCCQLPPLFPEEPDGCCKDAVAEAVGMGVEFDAFAVGEGVVVAFGTAEGEGVGVETGAW